MKHYKIICIVQVYNEIEKGNLARFFKYTKHLVDGIIVYDDCSTDGSYEYALKHASHVIRGVKNNFVHESNHKQQLVNYALTLQPDYILRLDADEILSVNAVKFLQKLCEEGYSNNIDAYSFYAENIWRSRTWARIDSHFNESWYPRLWKVKECMKIPQSHSLHQAGIPECIQLIKRSNYIRIFHFGFSDKYQIAHRYLCYKKLGQRGYLMLDRLINEEKLKLRKINTKLLPSSLLIKDSKPKKMNFIESINMVENFRKRIEKPKYSIICLIYKDINWLKFVYTQVIKYTDLKDCEFYFVANLATPEIKEYLKSNYINHYIFEDQNKIEDEWYINNVYRAWNFAASKAEGDFLVFINSDMAFTHGWLDNLIASYNGKNCITSRLVESGKLKSGKYGIEGNFGYQCKWYRENRFQKYAKKISLNEIHDGGLYMPLLIRKTHFESVKGYPEGNILPNSSIWNPKIAMKGDICISGDAVLMDKLSKSGITHQTAFNSVVYHFQMGEMDSKESLKINNNPSVIVSNDLVRGTLGEKVLWDYLLSLNGIKGLDSYSVKSRHNFEKKVSSLINHSYKSARIIIQNATFMKRVSYKIFTTMLLQDNLRRLNRKDLEQETNLKFADRVVTNSLQVFIDYPEYDFTYIPIGVNSKLFRPMKKDILRKKYDINAEKVGIFVGSFNRVKGFEEIKSIISRRKDIYWILVTKYEEHYQSINSRVYKAVTQEKLVELINCADFFILGSKEETQCLAAIEAGLCNIPIIMHKVGIFSAMTDKDLKKVGKIGGNLEASIDLVMKNKYHPRKVFLKMGIDIETMQERWTTCIKEWKIESEKKRLGLKSNGLLLLLKILNFRIRIKYFGKEYIDFGDIGRLIIKCIPNRLYYNYRILRYGRI